MKISESTGSEIEATVTFLELEGIKNCLNEVTGGLGITNFKNRIGVDEDVVSHLLDQMVSVLSAHTYGQVQTGDPHLPLYIRRSANRK
jgi:hypothetical protein